MTSRKQGVRDKGMLGVLLVVALAVSALAIENGGRERNAVRRLPEAERHELYERTLKNLSVPCAPETHTTGLDAFCRGQAEFILDFSECDATCSALARRHLNGPSR